MYGEILIGGHRMEVRYADRTHIMTTILHLISSLSIYTGLRAHRQVLLHTETRDIYCSYEFYNQGWVWNVTLE